ncbi:FliI/YscN family ATPase [Klugiella sp. YN-L-19]|uniref:FliI/YscN family ATPase n=2 Tax=Ruicaihuangia caeni TaxID=3042517 RepID=A0AAW6T242_9MICO|nr:FliI/YscN family ATPase [Klugiella sp. YN-L-19]MDI2097881.1 FliI/YscN family ATPase [Klugiella sp. YN-L-19]
MRPAIEAALHRARRSAAPHRVGRLSSMVGLSLEVTGLDAAIGEVIMIDDAAPVAAEVVAASTGRVRCMPLTNPSALRVGAPARRQAHPSLVPTGATLLGRVLDGLGRPIDGLGPLRPSSWVSLTNDPPGPLERTPIATALPLGVRVLDTLTPVGRGQRLGLFAGSGVGKSSLLSMIARGSTAEVTVIALIGERGREVREFLEHDLGPEGLARSVVVVSTSDEPALMRLRAAFLATRIAETFRDDGADCVLMMDSLTRAAAAQREIGLTAGEPPATRGYPPSTFSMLARLLERAGPAKSGSITGIYTVLVDGDDHNEPVADAARSILDGHIVLTRELAVAGHFPAVDPLASVSRLSSRLTDAEQRAAQTALRRVLAARAGSRDLIDVGAYHAGTNPRIDAALRHSDAIEAFLTQRLDELVPADRAWAELQGLAALLGAAA